MPRICWGTLLLSLVFLVHRILSSFRSWSIRTRFASEMTSLIWRLSSFGLSVRTDDNLSCESMLPLALPLHYPLISFSPTAIRRRENEERRETEKAEKSRNLPDFHFASYLLQHWNSADILIAIETRNSLSSTRPSYALWAELLRMSYSRESEESPKPRSFFVSHFASIPQFAFLNHFQLCDDFMSAHCFAWIRRSNAFGDLIWIISFDSAVKSDLFSSLGFMKLWGRVAAVSLPRGPPWT
jgi:hypothetical protein